MPLGHAYKNTCLLAPVINMHSNFFVLACFFAKCRTKLFFSTIWKLGSNFAFWCDSAYFSSVFFFVFHAKSSTTNNHQIVLLKSVFLSSLAPFWNQKRQKFKKKIKKKIIKSCWTLFWFFLCLVIFLEELLSCLLSLLWLLIMSKLEFFVQVVFITPRRSFLSHHIY